MTLCRFLPLLLTLQFLFPVSLSSQPPQNRADLIITGGTIVTMDGARTIYADGAVAVKSDTIVAVGPRAEVEAKYVAGQTISAEGKLVLPGFINGHTHVPMTLFRGLHDDVTLNDWLYKYIFPAEAKNVNEEFVRWGTRLAAAERSAQGSRLSPICITSKMLWPRKPKLRACAAYSGRHSSIFRRRTTKASPRCSPTPRGF